MPEQYVLITTSKYRKGVQVGVQKTGTQAEVEAYRSEKKWAGKRPQPFVIKESEVEAFTAKHQTGIFVPTYDPVKAREEEAAKIRRQKEQEVFERRREAAKLPGREGDIARLRLAATTGIQAKPPELTQKEFVEQRTLQRLREGTTLTTYTKYGEPPTAQTFGLEALTPESKAELEKFKEEERKRKAEELFARQKRVAPVKERVPFTKVTGELLVRAGEPLPRGRLTLIGAVREKEGPIIGGVRTELTKLYPKSPYFTETIAERMLAIKKHPIKETIKPLAIGVGFGVLIAVAPPLGIAAGIIGTTALGAGIAAAPPGMVRQQMVGRFVADIPFLAIGGRVGAGIAPALPRPSVGTISIQTKVGDIAIKTYGIRMGERAMPIVTKTPRGLKWGRTDISPELTQLKPGVDIKVGGALETALIRKGLRAAPDVTIRGREAISPAQKILVKTKYTKADIELQKRTERLTPREFKEVLDIAKEEQAVVFGSVARGKKFSRDIDLRLDKASEVGIERVVGITTVRLRGVGAKVRAIKDMPGAIEKRIGKEWVKVVEWKGKEPFVKGEYVPEEILGLTKTGKPIKKEGLLMTSLSEELRGVTQGVIRVRKDVTGKLDIYPSPKRVKDIESMFETAEVLRQQRLIPSQRLKTEIEKLRGLFPEGVRKPITKRLIADFRPSPAPRITIPSIVSIGTISPTARAVSPSARIVSVSPRISPVSPRVSISPRPSVSARPSPRSVSRSVSYSPSVRVSPSLSKSPSVSRSVSPSPSISKSVSRSPSPSMSVSFSPSLSVSKSVSYSVSPSPSYSPSMSQLYVPTPPPPRGILLPKPRPDEKKRRKRLLPFGREYGYSPSLSWVLGGKGVIPTPAQRVGKVAISPMMIRALPEKKKVKI